MEQNESTENKEKIVEVNGDADIEMELPAMVVQKTVLTKKKKTKMINHSKHKKISRDADAPKYPKTGYVRFTTIRRDELKIIFPDLSVLEITKKLAEEWNGMSDEKKKPYLDAATIDKDRYRRESIEYNKKVKAMEFSPKNTSPRTKSLKSTAANTINGNAKFEKTPTKSLNRKDSVQNNSEKKKMIKSSTVTVTPPPSPPFKDLCLNNAEIPIFTEQFLEHNRQIDTDLKKIRKSNIELEQQNSVLEKHVENMKNGIEKLTNETNKQLEENKKIQQYFDDLRQKLATALSDLAIPTEPNGANLDNIEKYMNDLHEMAKTNSHGPASLNKAKDILRKIDLST